MATNVKVFAAELADRQTDMAKTLMIQIYSGGIKYIYR